MALRIQALGYIDKADMAHGFVISFHRRSYYRQTWFDYSEQNKEVCPSIRLIERRRSFEFYIGELGVLEDETHKIIIKSPDVFPDIYYHPTVFDYVEGVYVTLDRWYDLVKYLELYNETLKVEKRYEHYDSLAKHL